MAVGELIMWGAVGGGGGIGALAHVWVNKLMAKKKESALIDGRTPKEWYEILKDLGREEYERLSRGALDGLEESDKYGKWDIKPLLKDHYHTLMKEWYPNKYCSYCGNPKNSNGDCFWDGPCVGKYSRAQRSLLPPGIKTRPEASVNPYRAKSEREVEVQIDHGSGVVRITPRATKQPVRQMHIWDAGPTFRKHYIAIIDVGMRGTNERGYRIVRDDENWLAGRDEIGAFQTRKGLQPTGRIDFQTKDALIRYLDAGNPWPVEFPIIRKPLNEIDKIHRELQKWTNE